MWYSGLAHCREDTQQDSIGLAHGLFHSREETDMPHVPGVHPHLSMLSGDNEPQGTVR